VCGAGLVLGYAMLGAAWLTLKTEGDLRDWAYRRLDWLLAAVVVVLIVVFAFALATQMRVLDRWLNDHDSSCCSSSASSPLSAC
jgi:cytochrome d ubiquinol oxidase subunit II